MKKSKVLIILVIALLVSAAGIGALKSYMNSAGLRLVKAMGNGINMGNTLDATNLWDYDAGRDELDYETFWGNPKLTAEQFQAVRDAGFKCVRIPVTWEDHIGADGKISEVWMERVAQVVDVALEQELYVIINTHHEEWLNLEEDKKEQIKADYANVWTQIAMRFRDYDEKLLFEGMNEVRLRDSKHEWSGGTPVLREMVNELNGVFVESVRETGGENEDRYLIISPYCHRVQTDAMKELTIPEGNIIVAVHMYEPYRFCQQDEGSPDWNGEETKEVADIREIFDEIEELYIRQGIPVMITEFGCKDKDNTESRVAWTKLYCELAKERGISCFWWDNGKEYQLLDRETGEWVYPEIVKVLVE